MKIIEVNIYLYLYLIFYFFYLIDVVCQKIVKDFKNYSSIGLNINEITVNKELINDKDL